MCCATVCIVVLNWNGLEDTRECLQSLKRIAYPNYQVVVVDNGSDGDDSRVLKREFGDCIQLVQNDRNYGCGEGLNTGIRYALGHARPDYMLVMNNDVVVAPDFLGELVRVADSDHTIGVVGPKIYYYDYGGRNDVIWSAGGRIRWWALRLHSQHEGSDDSARHQKMASVDWISGAVMMFRTCLVEEVGLLDAWYFFGFEDIDYCFRARRLGYKVIYVPTAKAWHKVGASAAKLHITHASPSCHYHFVRQYFPLPVYLYQVLLFPVRLLRWGALYLLKSRDRRALVRFLSDCARLILRGKGVGN